MNATAVQSKSEAKELLDIFASQLYASFGMRASALVSAMIGRLKHDEEVSGRLESELDSLSSGYHKYLDVMDQLKAHEKSIEKLRAVIGYGAAPYGLVGQVSPESPDDLEYEKESKGMRRSLELWEAVEQYLRFVSEAKVKEIMDFMSAVRIKASRQSIEAAIKAHPKVFRVQKRKGEKFISLKGV